MRKKLRGVIMVIIILILWEVSSRLVNKSLFIPSPKETYDVIVSLFETGAFWKHLASSFYRVTLSIVISAVISLPLGMLISWCKPVQKALKPVVDALRYIPVTCFSSLLVLFLGIGEKMKITFLVIAATFSFLPTVIQTCTDDMSKISETGLTMGFSYPRMLLHCIVPFITPSLIQSLINLYGVGWTYVIIAEMNNTQYGLGHLMYIGSARGRTAMVYAAIVILVVVSVIFDKLAKFVVKKCFPWKKFDA